MMNKQFLQHLAMGIVLVFGSVDLGVLSSAATANDDPKGKQQSAEKASSQKTSPSQKKKPAVKKKPPKSPTGVMHLTLRGNYAEQPSNRFNPVATLLGQDAKEKPYYRLARYVDKLAERDDIKVVVLDLSASVSLNRVLCRDLCRRITKLHDQGKKTIAWLENASTIDVCLASACDEVFMANDGIVDIPSAAMDQVFYKDLFDFAGIRVSHVRAGDFKGAVEPYTRSTMSSHLREHYVKLLTSTNDIAVRQIARGRKLPPASIRRLQQQRLMLSKDAKKSRLVDRLADAGMMREAVAARLGRELKWFEPKSPKPQTIGLTDILGAMMAGDTKKKTVTKPSIVVYHLSGTIVDGNKPSSGSIVSGPTVKAINDLRTNDMVKGVVVRINSPGGGATASEKIRAALAKLVAAKPTVFSMGSVAASGGYLVACADAPVYADPDTITGSIGVFGIQTSFEPLMRRVGIQTETVALDDAAAGFRPGRPWTDHEQKKLQTYVDTTYGEFVGRVAKARSLRVDEVKKIAGGRVWTGAQAKELGLVDHLGGLSASLDDVRGKIEEKRLPTKHLPEVSTGLDLSELLGGDDEELFSGELAKRLGHLKAMGFETETLEFLLRSAGNNNGKPHMHPLWMLQPMNFQIR